MRDEAFNRVRVLNVRVFCFRDFLASKPISKPVFRRIEGQSVPASSFKHFSDKFSRARFGQRSASRHILGSFERKAHFQRFSAIRLLRTFL